MKIAKYAEAFDIIGVSMGDKVKNFIKALEAEGYYEKSICYAIWRGQEKIMQYKGDPRFLSVLQNEVRKYGFKRSK